MKPNCPHCQTNGSVMSAARAAQQSLTMGVSEDYTEGDWFCAFCQTSFGERDAAQELKFAP